MPVAFVVINVDVGSEQSVLEKLRKLPSVKEAHYTFGIYDIIVKLEFEDSNKLKEFVFSQIRKIENIRSTITLMVY